MPNTATITQPLSARELAATRNALPSGNSWITCCPAHDDDYPLLSISEGENGRVRLYCYAQCPPVLIAASMGLDISDWLEPEPAPELGCLLDEILKFVRRYVVMTQEEAAVVTLWIAHTHVIEAFHTTPYLRVGSITKRCGKTRLLEVLKSIAANPILASRITTAALVRIADAICPTLLLDESDAAFKGDPHIAENLRGILDGGYERNGQSILCGFAGKDWEPRVFRTFCPKVIAGIGNLPDTVADRSIPIVLQRRLRSEPIERWRVRRATAIAAPFKRALELWRPMAVEALRAAEPVLPEELSDRAQDIWEPLVALADLAGGSWPAQTRKAAVTLCAAVHDVDPFNELLSDLRDLLAKTTGDFVFTETIIPHLVSLDDRPWRRWRKGRPITEHGLARLLRSAKVYAGKGRAFGSQARGYRRAALEDAFARYLTPQVSQCPTPNEIGHQVRDTSVSRDTDSERNRPAISGVSIASGTLGHIEGGGEHAEESPDDIVLD